MFRLKCLLSSGYLDVQGIVVRNHAMFQNKPPLSQRDIQIHDGKTLSDIYSLAKQRQVGDDSDTFEISSF